MGTLFAAALFIGFCMIGWEIVKFVFRALFMPAREVVEVVIRRK
jgi:hypothetical protein